MTPAHWVVAVVWTVVVLVVAWYVYDHTVGEGFEDVDDLAKRDRKLHN